MDLSVYLVVDAPNGADLGLYPDQATALQAPWLAAFKAAIAPTMVKIISVQSWLEKGDAIVSPSAAAPLICPLTLQVPDIITFPAQSVYQRCRDVASLRHQVQQTWGYQVGDGRCWLPIVLTAKGPLYAEAIQPKSTDMATLPYTQPFHLPDSLRQLLYRMGYDLLTTLAAPPSVYLLQFGLEGDRLWFDRLWPFPHYPALASIGVQSPNLFDSHWRCLTHQPILDVTIEP